jgi:hypothetical protein
MPSTLKWLPRPKVMHIKYGKGMVKAKVFATYTRTIKGKKHTSHYMHIMPQKKSWTGKLRRK